MRKAAIMYGLGLCLVLLSCAKKTLEAPGPSGNDSSFAYPSHFPRPVYDFSKNPYSPKKVELGRMLFYDQILSRDSSISCASCHQPFAAFSHLKHDLSHGIGGRLGFRNTPGLFNLAWSPNFMWDGAIPNVETMPLAPITNHEEMDETLENVLKKLNRSPVYKAKFQSAFGIETIESTHMLKAMAQFLVSIVSSNSKYDLYMQGKGSLSSHELNGLKIVRQKCAPCHGGEMFTDYSFRNMGIDTSQWITFDLGREEFTKSLSDRRKFKTPTLRNLALTFPYLHDGRALNFNKTMAFHDTLIQDNANLDPLFKKNGVIGIKLTADERLDVYEFLRSALTDNTLSTNKAYGTPFDTYTPSDNH